MNIACPGLTHGLLSTSCSIVFGLSYNLSSSCLASPTAFFSTWAPFSKITQNTVLWLWKRNIKYQCNNDNSVKLIALQISYYDIIRTWASLFIANSLLGLTTFTGFTSKLSWNFDLALPYLCTSIACLCACCPRAKLIPWAVY